MVELKNMTNKKKAEYIWDYYKLYIIAFLVILLTVTWFVHNQVTEIDYVFNLTMVGNTINENKRSDFGNQLTKIVVKNENKRKQAIVNIIPFNGSNNISSTLSNQYMQKFIVSISFGEVDVVILNKDIFEYLAKQDMFSRLDNMPGLNLSSIKNEKIKTSGSNNTKFVYAIDTENIKILKDMGFDTHNKVIGIISKSKHKDKAASALEWILNSK